MDYQFPAVPGNFGTGSDIASARLTFVTELVRAFHSTEVCFYIILIV